MTYVVRVAIRSYLGGLLTAGILYIAAMRALGGWCILFWVEDAIAAACALFLLLVAISQIIDRHDAAIEKARADG